METAITIWIDESTEIKINNHDYNLVGYLITDSDTKELSFINSLKQARREEPKCWTTIHSSEIKEDDNRKLSLIDRWLELFTKSDGVYFHSFLYKRNTKYISKNETYENYFAKQSIFSLAHKMKKDGYVLNTMFKGVKTLTILFDRRRSHSADIVSKGGESEIKRINDLEDIYKSEIAKQIKRVTGKDSKTTEMTIRFSFVSSECFDAMQFTDSLLYLIRHKIKQGDSKKEDIFTKLFDKFFLDNLDLHTRSLGFKKIYEFDKKFNFFESNSS